MFVNEQERNEENATQSKGGNRNVNHGEMVEWFITAVLNAAGSKGSVGSNPTFSAILDIWKVTQYGTVAAC